MQLNRSSIWTRSNGEKVRVRDMSSAEMLDDINYLERMLFEETESDPYIVEQICAVSGTCPVRSEPQHAINGFLFEDWYNLFREELGRRGYNPISSRKRSNIFAKMLRFW